MDKYNRRSWRWLPVLGPGFFFYFDKLGEQKSFFFTKFDFCLLNILYSFWRYRFSTRVVYVPKAFPHIIYSSFYLLCSRIKRVLILCAAVCKRTIEMYLYTFILVNINPCKKKKTKIK